ncbi:ROK family protein [Lichenihabitans sp. PAMC28606]|uniref:ROK family protein n=1 Tax=Lichenihabitans sp. PAMC28606 TaxID=2880932 RepID=UPI001D0A18D0|nr:ROK family protein [Lichenihabitans sp. PAMC28606]UDL95765.1 ROK family protein [Lichenihabitans sp. PAMC28606]
MSDLRTLAIDIGGTGLKASVLDQNGAMIHDKAWRKTPTDLTPASLLSEISALIASLPDFDRVSVGFPGAVRRGHVLTAPHFEGPDWANYNLAQGIAQTLHKPTRLANDADIQGLGVVSGKGIEAVLTLGTGAGTAFFQNGVLAPHMEFAHHAVHKKYTYNSYVGRDALADVGKKRWNRRVHKVIQIVNDLVHYDRLYIGGGNASKIDGSLPDNVTIVDNAAGITGGIALWRDGAGFDDADGLSPSPT